MKSILALDQGTTSSRAILFDADGNPLGTAQREFAQHFPQPGWVEHDAREIWESQLATAQHVIEKTNTDAADVAAVGITNQRETVVVWDRDTGQPIHPAIVWQDRRTGEVCQRLVADGLSDTVRDKTGLVIDAYFSATKVAWILDHVDGARARAERGELAFGTIDSWLIYKLTRGLKHVTDASNASRTMLFNIHEQRWDAELLDVLRVPAAMLPEVVDSSGVVGETDPTLFGGSIPIAGIAGDQQAALFGNLCHAPGTVKTTYGTGCFMLLNTGDRPVASGQRLLTTVAWRMNGTTTYALEGSVFIGGATVQWLRDGLGIIDSAAEIEALAASVPDADGVILVPAFAGLGAPHWDPRARGVIAGLTRGTTRGHLARAALEGIAFQVADVLDVMRADHGRDITSMRVDGGASANNLLMQIQADLSQAPLVRPKVTETTALGAAYLAGLAVGFWDGPEQIERQWTEDRGFSPHISRAEAQDRRAAWLRGVERAGEWEQ
ncbi:MAG: glycerol kinase GlpK [Planctomycetota bacterium]